MADGTQAEPSHPWLRHPDETAKAYAAFRYYRDLSEARSIRQVAQKFTISDTLAKRWSTVHAWVSRVRAWDEHQDRIAVALSTDAIQTRPTRAIQAAALETLDVRMKRWRDRGARRRAAVSRPFEAARLIQIARLSAP